MNRKHQSVVWITGILAWLGCVYLSTTLWGSYHDPFALVRYLIRMVVVVPVATILALGAVLLFDHMTPDDWLESITDDQHGNLGTKLATGIVVASLVLSVFWLAIQG